MTDAPAPTPFDELDARERPLTQGPATPSVPVVPASPVLASERLTSLDFLRGFALCGILVMNIVAFAWPMEAYSNPLLAGGFAGLDRVVWYVSHLFFELKMMTLFSMLFGAGLVLQSERAEVRGAKLGATYYRRVGVLLCIGLLHAIFVWEGDILFQYGMCGLFLFLFRRVQPTTLLVLGAVSLLVFVPLSVGMGALLDWMSAAAARVDAARAAGEVAASVDLELARGWKDVKPYLAPGIEEMRREVASMRGGYADIVRKRAVEAGTYQPIYVVFYGWRIFGAMLIGMALLKLGVLSGARSRRLYLVLATTGLTIGLPLVAFGAVRLERAGFDAVYLLRVGGLYNYFGSIAVALGYVGLLGLLWQSGRLPRAVHLLTHAGRMALTNYLLQSLLCTTLFYGYGFGLFGTMGRTGLLGIVVAVLALELTFSAWWMSRFRFGPAEWVWRSLTYWRRQPMRLPASP